MWLNIRQVPLAWHKGRMWLRGLVPFSRLMEALLPASWRGLLLVRPRLPGSGAGCSLWLGGRVKGRREGDRGADHVQESVATPAHQNKVVSTSANFLPRGMRQCQLAALPFPHFALLLLRNPGVANPFACVPFRCQGLVKRGVRHSSFLSIRRIGQSLLTLG